uniref:Uncharacterized protein n=1 Tax=Arcella intermedia TaxID=1963864 RepID=A0A6B2L9Z0_9EUKA
MVKTKKTQKKSDESLVKKARWLACALTNQPLQQRIVCDAFGNVFNKEAILKCLIEKTMPEGFNHIRSIKDVFDLHFTRNQKYDETQQIHVGMEGSLLDSPFECPLTGKPVNGQHAFSALRSCGHVFSDKGLQEILADSNCFVCQKHFRESDVVILNPPEDVLFELRVKFLEQMKEKKAERKKEKVKDTKTKEKANEKTKEKLEKDQQKGKEVDKEKVKNEANTEKAKEETKKRKIAPTDPNPSNPKKPKTTPQQPPNVRNVMAVSSSLNQISQSHDLKKQSSNAYKSIFSTAPSFAPQYLTGIVKGVIK